MQQHRTWIEISRSALRHNVRTLRTFLEPRVAMLAMVKSNAYGHGITGTSTVLEGIVDWYGVDTVSEAQILRAAGRTSPILIVGDVQPPELSKLVQQEFRYLVTSAEALNAIDEAARTLKKKAYVHLKIDTGMSRQGILPYALPDVVRSAHKLVNVELEGIATHLANADDVADPSFTNQQLLQFNQTLRRLEENKRIPKLRHASNSAALMLYPNAHYDLVRPGIALYGLWPSADVREELKRRDDSSELKPVLSMRTHIAQVKTIPQGSLVGYNCTQRVDRETRIAILPVGYADGYNRGLSSKGEVLVHGRRAKVLGRISMCLTVVDVTDIPGARKGDVATLIGQDGFEEITADSIASVLSTINYEVVASLNTALPRVLV